MDITLWLESLTIEEHFLLTYGCIIAFGLLMIPVAVWIDRKMDKEDNHGRK